MITDKFGLKLFFHELIELGVSDLREGHSRIGFSCSKLLEDMCVRQDPFLDRIINDYSEDSHEYRINNAGLKMHWKTTKNYRGQRMFVCSIGGDQEKDYIWFVSAARMLFRKHGCCKIQFREDKRGW